MTATHLETTHFVVVFGNDFLPTIYQQITQIEEKIGRSIDAEIEILDQHLSSSFVCTVPEKKILDGLDFIWHIESTTIPLTKSLHPKEVLAQFEDNSTDVGGLPPNAICTLVTEREYGDWGKSCVAVTHTQVLEAYHPYPAQYASWRIVRSHNYDTSEQLQKILARLTKQPKSSCWS